MVEEEKLLGKEERWKNETEENRIMLSWNCVEMLVYGLQHAGPSSPGTLPTSLFVPSSIWTTHHPPDRAAHPKTCLLFILPKFSHVFPILHSFPWPDLDPDAGVYGCRGIHPPRFPGNYPALHANPCSELCQLMAVWLSCSPYESGHRCTLSELHYGLVTFLPLPNTNQ